MPITLDDVKTAVAIIESSEGSEITLRFGDVTLIVRRGEPDAAAVPTAAFPVGSARPASPGVHAPGAAMPAAGPAAASGAPSMTAVPLTAPLSGVIYHAPAPGEPPFVTVGAGVGPEDTVCIIDLMKVMNLIKAPVAGRIARLDALDGQQVSKGDPILWIDPA